jgi:hypothetical protein
MNSAAGFGRRMIVAAVVASLGAIGGPVSVAEAAPMFCPAGALTLSGGTSPTETIGVDDDLELRLNGVTIFSNTDQFATELPPISFTADFGDELRVIATNSTVFGGHEGIDPLYLHCDATGEIQVLDPVGIDIPSGPPGEVFSDRTFIIQFVRTPTSKKQCKKGGWRTFPQFRNQGDCVSFVATGGKNPPAGLAAHRSASRQDAQKPSAVRPHRTKTMGVRDHSRGHDH